MGKQNIDSTQNCISSARLKQLAELDVPYNGYVDDGTGAIAHVSIMNINTYSGTCDSIFTYRKQVSIAIDELRYVVQSKDQLQHIAQYLNLSPEEIAAQNELTDLGELTPGQELSIAVDIQYSYTVDSEIDTAAFTPTAENNYKPLSEREIYSALDYANTGIGSLGSSIGEHAGRSRIGNNWRPYWEKPSGRVFYGNQYVKTYVLKPWGKIVGKVGLGTSVAFEIVEIYDGIRMDGDNFGYNAQKQLAGGVGSIGGGWAGVWAGGMAGTALAGALAAGTFGAAVTAWCGGVGAIPCAIVGGFVGGVLGAILGEAAAEEAYDLGYDKLQNK